VDSTVFAGVFIFAGVLGDWPTTAETMTKFRAKDINFSFLIFSLLLEEQICVEHFIEFVRASVCDSYPEKRNAAADDSFR
jgi:hypothetical protein